MRVLITGGTGSFGNAVVNRLLAENTAEEIVIFSRDELKQHEMRERLNDRRLTFWVGDVRDREAVREAMVGVDTVFHAAALKQVPTGEFFPMELIRTNVIGTENVLDMAEQSDMVKRVVFLSTDKAVYPVNVMGMTKAIAERLIVAKHRPTSTTIFCAVRFGNVMASRGSVIPVFVDRIKRGKALRITDPHMTRFLLSLDDAMDLVLFAMQHGERNDLFIRKAPASTVQDLAQAMINIFNTNVGTEVVGMRAGEKSHETLATGLELAAAEEIDGQYYRVRRAGVFEYDQFFSKGVAKDVREDYTSNNTQRLTVPEIEERLRKLPFIQEHLPQ